jgi:hypothetical protein
MLYQFKSYRNYCKRLLTFAVICLFYPAFVSAQSGILPTDLLKFTNHSDSLTGQYPAEKAYLQFDKPYYALGDTVWFKAYLLNAPSLMLSAKSALLHIDISNDSGRLVKQYLFPVKNGVSWGNIVLSDKDFYSGTCTLHAYTNWMRNFGEGVFFCKTFYITGTSENNWLINTKISTSSISDKNLINAKLQFSNTDKTPFGNRPLQLQVMAGNKNLYKQKAQTDAGGLVDVNFTLPEKASGISIIAENEGRKSVIPVNIDRPEKIDLQFLPEGGDLIAGLPAHVGFKAIGEDGKGTNISGIITDHNNLQVASFQTLHNGMGSFYLNMQPGENYTAKVTLLGGLTKEYPLPVVKNSGSVLQVKNAMEGDSVEVSIAVTEDIAKTNADYFLIGKARGIVCYAAIMNFHDANYIRKKIAKRLFPSGITHFILMTAKEQPINERLVFINRNDDLNVKINTELAEYNARDSVALYINVDDNTGKPVSGNFSLAVTDDAQVKTDSLRDENIINRMLLTSDIKGYIEKPGYYLSSKNAEAWKALDNLMLTQGWVRYDLLPTNIQYKAEQQFEVTGNVRNVFNSPVKGTDVLLFSKAPMILMDTTTDKGGKFVFDRFPKVDTPVFILKAVNRHGKSFNVIINVDEIKPPLFTGPPGPEMMPWYVNSDSTLLNYTRTNEQLQLQANFPTGKHALKEVKILAKKTIADSENLNGPGDADLVLDEKDMEKAGKKNWLQLFQENIKGFRVGTYTYFKHSDVDAGGGVFKDVVTPIPTDGYFIKGKKIAIIVDGIPLDSISLEVPTLLEETRFLESRNAEDIKGIELNFSPKYSNRYIRRYVRGEEYDPIMRVDYAFIEITTRSGNGPFFDTTPGLYLYKPLPISWSKQFYKPKYAVTDTAKRSPDLRSTINWEPNIITDADGKATVWFYAADKPSTYTITIEGADFNGNLGYKRQKITISKAIATKSK